MRDRSQQRSRPREGPAFGLLLLFYAFGIWRMRSWAFPIGLAYAVHVILNLSLYCIRNAGSPVMPPPLFMFGYIVVAVGISLGSALSLYRRRENACLRTGMGGAGGCVFL